MAPKKASAVETLSTASTTTQPAPVTARATIPANPQNAAEIVSTIWSRYLEETPIRTKLIDAFMLFLMLVGGLQFVYVCLVGNYPFNAFLSGFGICVGQFVLAASLRIQTNPENAKSFGGRSEERAFAEFIFGSFILHFFCINFIN